ncbi:MAG: CoA transferase [Dehalococcoidia bacterium]|nr:CoA transferase [Dehalococcoidia bacterium]
MPEEQEGALSGYRILDLADSKGVYCTKLLADMGAEVVKIEKPQGDATRSIPPFVDDVPHMEKSLHFFYRNANKYGITLNLECADGKAIFKKLVETADVLVETHPPGYMESLGLDYAVLREIKAGLIMASITEFGQSGPYRNWKGSEIVDFALSDTMIGSGFPDKAPCNLPGTPAYDAASLVAAMSIVVSLYHRGSTGLGQHIDTSVHECSRLGLYPWMLPIYSYNINPDSPPPPPEGRLGASIYPVYPCKDGYVRVIALTPRQWDSLLKVLNEPEVLCLPEWRDFIYRIANAADLYALMLEFTAKYTMAELFEAGHREGVPIVPIYDVAGFVNSPQTKAREFFVGVDHPVVGKVNYPGPPYKWTETPCKIRRSAPCLGEHNDKVYCQELGFSKEHLSALRRAGVI